LLLKLGCAAVQPELVENLLANSPIPIQPEQAEQLTTYLSNADGATINTWVDWGEILAAAAKRVMAFAALVSRVLPLVGLLMALVWVRSCVDGGAVVAAAAAATKAAAAASKTAARRQRQQRRRRPI
jgi:hypothetical protein